jgi:hypothetical protein
VPVCRLLDSSVCHEFSNLKLEGDAAQAECVARVEKGFVSGSAIMTQLPILNAVYQRVFFCSVVF